MRQSQLFTKTSKQAPKDEVSNNAIILQRAGFIHKEMAGVYSYLPLGLRVVEKIKNIVREEMNNMGGQELLMSSLQRKEVWEGTDRWDDEKVDVWFKSKLKNETEVGFGWSHEEPIGIMMKSFISSYKDLPAYVYQFQNKLRNELRAKSGIMRGREFLMKDLYSFSLDEAQHEAFYDGMKDAYMRVFDRVGIGHDTFVTFASGGAFTEFSHEFQTITDAGEDTIYIHREKNIAINEEVLTDKTLSELGVKKDELEKVKTAEVGNIFNFGRTKCEQLGLTFADETDTSVGVHLGSYGIGITRLMGVVVERNAKDGSMIWPESIAPFKVHLISLCTEKDDIAAVEKIYASLTDVLYDDRTVRAGAKFADADLIGLPHRIVISPKTLENGTVEYTNRMEQTEELISLEDITQRLS